MRVLFFLLLSLTSLSAQVDRQPISLEMINSKIKIIDIRTPDEWEETGIVKGAIPIMFFDKKRNYNLDEFLKKLDKIVKKDEHFAIIDRAGNRAGILGAILGEQHAYNVTVIKGGMQDAIMKNIPIQNYNP
jgi:rhodanese-related sulfurtransferase